MRKGIIPVTLGTVVIATGIMLDSKQANSHSLKRNNPSSLVGTFLIGLGAAHILLGSIDIATDTMK